MRKIFILLLNRSSITVLIDDFLIDGDIKILIFELFYLFLTDDGKFYFDVQVWQEQLQVLWSRQLEQHC